MYCNLSHYIVIAIVCSDHRRESLGTVRWDVWMAMPDAE